MPPVSTAFAKNVIRRAFSQLVDPSPDPAQVSQIWEFFESRCAYCDRQLARGSKEGHIDHLSSASVGGRNHVSNRVLSCAMCNEQEKRDMAWEQFLGQKADSPETFESRRNKILAWQKVHQFQASMSDKALLAAAESAALEVTSLLEAKVAELKALRGKVRDPKQVAPKPQTNHQTPSRSSNGVQEISANVARVPSNGGNHNVRYKASRLSFKADVIEPLRPEDRFRIDTPLGSFEMSKADFYADFSNVVQSNSYREAKLYHYSKLPERASKYRIREGNTRYSLDTILDRLNQRHQRATYGAVAGLTGQYAAFLLEGRPKNHRHSWIVNQQTGLPTGYPLTDSEKKLLQQNPVINTPDELRQWLSDGETTG